MTKLWEPSAARRKDSVLSRFAAAAEKRTGRTFGTDYRALHRWSCDDRETFWDLVWDFCNVIGEKGDRIAADIDRMPGARYFPDAKLNFAENMLRKNDDTIALVFRGEDKVERTVTWKQLNEQVSRLQQMLAAAGVKEGDRVTGFMPNMPETVMAMLAAVSLGAVWSSCSPDFGINGVLDRFGQIEPTILFAADGYFYNGKTLDCLERVKAIAEKLPNLKKIVIVPYVAAKPDVSALGARAQVWGDAIAPHAAKAVTYRRMPFNHPLYIMYSSGTTGMPKCIVHGAGGTLLKHLQEQQIQSDLKPEDTLFFFTTCGWMMWNWLVSGLATGSRVLLYDGAPSYPNMNVIFDYADAWGMTHLGTSAKFIDALIKAGTNPKQTHKLKDVRVIFSTGSPLAPAGFDYVYESIKTDVQLASISGGTDIIGCFVGGNPWEAVYRSEIQGPMLGMDVQAYDEDGKPLPRGQKGELVCQKSFPSMPIGFWNDADGKKYHEAYFSTFPNVWCHGDYVEVTDHGGVVIYGRSDAVLNPGGVRIGTAEIYRQVETMEEVVESLVIGQDWDNDVRVVLFVRLKPGLTLDAALTDKIRQRIRANTTPRHVPAKVVQVADIPRTISGKIVELAVRNVVHGRPVKNKAALANPDALDLFANLKELAS
jgi:acetoacetyl-CoA synthetase